MEFPSIVGEKIQTAEDAELRREIRKNPMENPCTLCALYVLCGKTP